MAAGRKSIAVLPFVNLSPDRDQQYFCDGMAEELITALTRIPDLKVISRSTAFSFKGKDMPSSEIGKELNVDTLLEGSVRRSADRIRVAVQLINVTDSYQIWADRFDREMRDVFDVQDEISSAVVAQLKIKLLGKEAAPLVRRPTTDVEAYNLYLKGRYLWNGRTEAGLRESITCFEEAINIDPDFALAHAGLADTYNVLGFYCVLAPRVTFPKSKAAASRALEIDDKLAEAHAAKAYALLLFDWKLAAAEKSFKQALSLNPEYASAHHWYSECLVVMGRLHEAAMEARKALESDPKALIIHTLLGWTYYFSYDYDTAIATYRKTIKIDPGFVPVRLFLGLACIQKGMYNDAITEFQRAREVFGTSGLILALIAYAQAMMGDSHQAQKQLEELLADSDETYLPPYFIAAIYAALYEHDKAIVWLNKALDARDNWMVFLNIDPIWHTLRGDPDFKVLLGKAGLEI